MSSLTLTKEQVNKIARLTKLPLSDEQAVTLSYLLSDTLRTIDTLKELDTTNVEETYQVNGLTNVYQKDEENRQTLPKEKALQNAGEVVKGLFATKAVFDR